MAAARALALVLALLAAALAAPAAAQHPEPVAAGDQVVFRFYCLTAVAAWQAASVGSTKRLDAACYMTEIVGAILLRRVIEPFPDWDGRWVEVWEARSMPLTFGPQPTLLPPIYIIRYVETKAL